MVRKVHCRFSEEQYEVLQSQSKKLGMSKARYIRFLLETRPSKLRPLLSATLSEFFVAGGFKDFTLTLDDELFARLELYAVTLDCSRNECVNALIALKPNIREVDPDNIETWVKGDETLVYTRGEYRALRSELKIQGANINQMARAMNTIADELPNLLPVDLYDFIDEFWIAHDKLKDENTRLYEMFLRLEASEKVSP